MKSLLPLAVLLVSAAGAAHAADTLPAEISVSASGEVRIPPTRASFAVVVSTTGATSAAATAENARVTDLVRKALAAAGLGKDELRRSRLQVNPRWEFPKGERQRRGYDASNVLEIETTHLERVGVLVDTAVEAGASGVQEVVFSADERAAARREALARAVAAARDDAETIAHAAGATLGELRALSTDGGGLVGTPMPMAMAMARGAGAPPTEVVANDITVSAQVQARWALVPAHH
jgi:hypothetical protein